MKNEVKTSEKDWLKKTAEFYNNKTSFVLLDDADLGINPGLQTLLQMGTVADISIREWFGILAALGMSSFGIYVVIAAISDPDPTSKLELMVLSGILLTLTGGTYAIKILTREKPPNIIFESFNNKFTIKWE